MVKDTLIYLVILVAVIYIPIKLGGFDDDLRRRGEGDPGQDDPTGAPASFIPEIAAGQTAYATLALGLGAGAVHVPARDHRDAERRRART